MDHAVFFLGFAHESAAIGFEDFDGFEDIVALEAEAGPGSFAFAAAVNADGGAAKSELAPDFHFELEFGTEGVLIEFDGAEVIGGPEGILDFQNGHEGGVTGEMGGASRGTLNAELRGTSGVSGLPKWRRAVSSRR